MEPGFWERVFVGVDKNANGTLEVGEKGILPTVIDFVGQVGTILVNSLLSGVESLLPNTQLAAAIPQLRQGYYLINLWFPVDLLITYMIHIWATFAAVTIVRFILKAAPTIW